MPSSTTYEISGHSQAECGRPRRSASQSTRRSASSPASSTRARTGKTSTGGRDGVTELDRYMRPYAVRWLTEQGVLG